MYEVVVGHKVYFKNVLLQRCKNFIARHNLTNARIRPVFQMTAA